MLASSQQKPTKNRPWLQKASGRPMAKQFDLARQMLSRFSSKSPKINQSDVQSRAINNVFQKNTIILFLL